MYHGLGSVFPRAVSCFGEVTSPGRTSAECASWTHPQQLRMVFCQIPFELDDETALWSSCTTAPSSTANVCHTSV